MARFGGDRKQALRYGRQRPWTDVLGVRHPYDWNTLDLVNETGIQGIAPWGSPAPWPSASPWYDLDWQRGISQAREGDEMWWIWHDIAGRLEGSNGAPGAAACASFTSE
jgi:hypothetical protein